MLKHTAASSLIGFATFKASQEETYLYHVCVNKTFSFLNLVNLSAWMAGII
jgi:hypothetical protein